MTVLTFRDAINQALHYEMERDSSVVVLGEDVSGGAGSKGGREAAGGIFGVTMGLLPKFGEARVIDTPISEACIVGAANGLALAGKRPVAEIMFADFLGLTMDQLMNQAAKFRYMFGGGVRCPIVARTTFGTGFSAAAQHSQALYAMVTQVPGLKVVVPSNPADAKGLMISAIRDDDPVIFFENKSLYAAKGEVPDGEHTVPLGKAAIVTRGDDVTVVAIGRMVDLAKKAAANLAADGIGLEVIDPRTLSPLDEETILDSVEKTGRFIVVDESPPRCSVARDMAALVAEKAFSSLRAPVKCVTAPHTPIPFAPQLEALYMPSVEKIEAAARFAMDYAARPGFAA